MSTADIAALQDRIGAALVAADPVAYWRQHLAEQPLDERGLRIAALLVAKLRFERLMNASPRANEWFARDPADFTAAFRRYHQSVTATALDPWGERDAFEGWLSADS